MPLFASSSAAPWARGLAGVPGGALAFAGLCLLGVLAIVCGLLFEIGRVRREGASGNVVIGRGQFSWRVASGIVWCAALGLLAYASSWGWPRHALGLGLDGRVWLRLLACTMILVLIGLMLLAHDLWRVRARSAAQEEAFRQGLNEIAQQEIERARQNRVQNPESKTPIL